MNGLPAARKPVRWVGSSRKDYVAFPDYVQDAFGYELFLLQGGDFPPSAKWMKGLSSVVELLEDYSGDTFRVVIAIQLESAVYVLHAFKKKSVRGIATPQRDIELIRHRLREAFRDDATRRKDST